MGGRATDPAARWLPHGSMASRDRWGRAHPWRAGLLWSSMAVPVAALAIMPLTGFRGALIVLLVAFVPVSLLFSVLLVREHRLTTPVEES